VDWHCSFEMCGGAAAEAPNKGLELTAYSVRSCLAPASSRSSGLALGGPRSGWEERHGAHQHGWKQMAHGAQHPCQASEASGIHRAPWGRAAGAKVRTASPT